LIIILKFYLIKVQTVEKNSNNISNKIITIFKKEYRKKRLSSLVECGE